MGSRIASASDPGTFCPNRVWPSTRVLCESQQKSKFLYLNDFLEFKILSIISRLFPLKLRSATAVTLPKSPGLLGPITYLTSRPEAYFFIVIQRFTPKYLFKCLDSFQYGVTLTSSEIVNLKLIIILIFIQKLPWFHHLKRFYWEQQCDQLPNRQRESNLEFQYRLECPNRYQTPPVAGVGQ